LARGNKKRALGLQVVRSTSVLAGAGADEGIKMFVEGGNVELGSPEELLSGANSTVEVVGVNYLENLVQQCRILRDEDTATGKENVLAHPLARVQAHALVMFVAREY
jgi:hypothetical protein